MILPWQTDTWRRLHERRATLPHALLFAGPAGQGKRAFAEAFAASLMCESPGSDGHACGQCVSCQWLHADTHPDLLRLVPGGLEAAEEGGEGEGAPKGKSAQILIEQVRALQEAVSISTHRGGRRVVLIDPAEAMNAYTANALLKLLEEPPEGCVFLLLSSQPRLLLPTLLSRCQRWNFPRPATEQALDWLRAESVADSEKLLALCGGMPLAAQRLANADGATLQARFVADIGALPEGDPLQLAGRWEDWLKAKGGQSAFLDLPTLVGWTQRWVSDLASLRLGGRIRYFPEEGKRLQFLAGRTGVSEVVACYNALSQIRRVVQHPLNTRLMLEDMLLRYVKAFAGAKS